MAKTLSEAQIKLLKEKLDFLMEKYEIEASDFMQLIDEDYSELEDYDFSDEMVNIDMNDEMDFLSYTIEEMLRYLENIEELQYDENSAWSKNIKQYIIAVDEWEVEKVNLTRFSFKSETLNIKFVKNPFYIGIAAVDQGIADDNYGITPCSRYVAAEFEYVGNGYPNKDEEIRILKQFLHTVSVETGIALKLGQFFFFDYDYYDIDEDDGNRSISITYGREDLLYYTKAMD